MPREPRVEPRVSPSCSCLANDEFVTIFVWGGALFVLTLGLHGSAAVLAYKLPRHLTYVYGRRAHGSGCSCKDRRPAIA